MELLVVVAIIMLLVALLMPSLRQARWRAKLAACMGNERQIGVAMYTFATDHIEPIARYDYGRGNGSWRDEDPSICGNGRALGATPSTECPFTGGCYGGAPAQPYEPPLSERNLILNKHGTWLIGNAAAIGAYYCPGLSHETLAPGWGSLGERFQIMKGWKKFFDTGGLDPSASIAGMEATNPTGYMMNRILAGDSAGAPSSLPTYNENGLRMSQVKGRWPVLADYRGGDGSGSVRANHKSVGYNVLTADGAVRFVRMAELITVGTSPEMYGPWQTYFQAWADAGLPPEDPTQGAYPYGWTDPFGRGNLWTWEAMRLAVQ